MSAAEKLKALERAAKGETQTFDEYSSWSHEREDVADALMNALPQIVAVVEAAEQMHPHFRGNGYIEREMRAALAALDEALT